MRVVYTDPKLRYKIVERIANGRAIRETIQLTHKERLALRSADAGNTTKPKQSNSSLVREFKRVRGENYLSDLMDCKVVDKYFEGEHKACPDFKPEKLRQISYDTTRVYMLTGSEIEIQNSHRVVIRNGRPIGVVDQRTLDKLVSNGSCSSTYENGKTIYKRLA